MHRPSPAARKDQAETKSSLGLGKSRVPQPALPCTEPLCSPAQRAACGSPPAPAGLRRALPSEEELEDAEQPPATSLGHRVPFLAAFKPGRAGLGVLSACPSCLPGPKAEPCEGSGTRRLVRRQPLLYLMNYTHPGPSNLGFCWKSLSVQSP